MHVGTEPRDMKILRKNQTRHQDKGTKGAVEIGSCIGIVLNSAYFTMNIKFKCPDSETIG